MTPEPERADQENERERRQQDPARDRADEYATQGAASDRADSHRGEERRAIAEDHEAPVAAVAGKSRQHRRKAHHERQATGELDVETEQKNEGRDEQLAPGDSEKH